MIADHGVSGVTTKLSDRPGGRRLLDKVRAGDQVIVRWVDRLGRNYDDATTTIRHLMNEGVVVKTVINAMVFDGSTTDPIQKAVRDAMIAFMAATAQAQAEATKAAQRAGIAHAKQQPETKYRGRKPSYTREQFDIVRTMLDQHQGVSAIARATDLSRCCSGGRTGDVESMITLSHALRAHRTLQPKKVERWGSQRSGS